MFHKFSSYLVALVFNFAFGFYLVSAQTIPDAAFQGEAASSAGNRELFSSFSTVVSPTGFLPLGVDADIFSFGGGAQAALSWQLAAIPALSIGFDAGYLFLQSLAPDNSISIGRAAALAGWKFQFTRAFSLGLSGEFGWFFAGLNGGGGPPGSNPFVSGGLSLGLDLSRTFGLGLDAGYQSFGGLSSGLSLGLFLKLKPESRSTNFALGAKDIKLLKGDGRGLDPTGIKLNTVFPVFYAYYDTSPIGKLYLKNLESVEATDIVVKVLVKQFMDEAKTSVRAERLAPGASMAIDIIGLFSDRILSTAEGTKVPVSVVIEYRQFGTTVQEEFVETLSIGDRNALIWDDDRKAAAFVSSKDPESLRISRSISVAVKDAILPGMNERLQNAIAIHETVRLLKLKYQADPSSAIVSGNRASVDFLQFPQQTLAFRTGDCDDLSILYASLFESLGVPVAFLTVPGHILVAVDLGISKDEAVRTFQNPGDLIESGGSVWLPLETTAQGRDFTFAWEEGARQWREGVSKKAASLISIRDAWKTYPAVVLPGTPAKTTLPGEKTILASFKAEAVLLVSREIDSRVAKLLAEAKKTGDPAVLNRLGVLYARFGQLDKAEAQFAASLKNKENFSALFNLGNLSFARGFFSESLSWYEKALKKSGTSGKTLIAIARAQVELGRLDAAKLSFEKAKAADPAFAERYAYLGLASTEIGRASSADASRREIEWTE